MVVRTNPVEALLDLHRTGALAARYPEVRSLLAGHSDGELARAGHLLARLDTDEVLRVHPDTPSVTVAITGHGTLAQLAPLVTAELARHGLLARTHVSDFDGYVFDLGDPGSTLYSTGADLVLCVLDPMIVLDGLPVPWRVEDVERIAAEKVGLIEGLAARFAGAGRGTLVLNTMPLPRAYAAQLVDHRSRARLGVVWREANARLLRLGEASAAVVLDLDPLVAEGAAAVDPRLSRYAKVHLSPALLAAYAREAGHLARQAAGRTRKALVLDLDGTVWGGVLGEDGVEGIEVCDGHRGEAFRSFQRVAKQLASQGVLLAVVSKNDPEPVRAALRDHPGMTLTESDLVRVVANWRPKHENLKELARTLNIGTDSLVFADDSAYECGLVRRELPEVAVVQLGTEPALHIGALLRDAWFDVRELTDEDRTRGRKYREDLDRRDFLDAFESIEDYLRELEVTVRLGDLAEADVGRVSQLTLRTNQFNMTTRRMRPDEVRSFPGRVLTVRSADRFGDNGLVGAIFTRRDEDTVRIDNFLLSCRVFSRGIEQAALAEVLRQARESGAKTVTGHYRPSAKNHKVKDFYLRNGFTEVGNGAFRHDLDEDAAPPGHVRLIVEGGP
ncbi:HAD-IIIC family phosphatase [Actinomadura opuntiae]|uniref:HAD-IIIC family phosphatase n=1 Tax=Actinomadura sp. OS1-43 TaxID=604315 RepID=UPI00255B1602|nr:HAD-IIIC family phosphatase [Actinomadura sp. OS1-43]MDL4815411.1 HAD-IIIC family phosphatase [Actinomadura sp. OS1-43]